MILSYYEMIDKPASLQEVELTRDNVAVIQLRHQPVNLRSGGFKKFIKSYSVLLKESERSLRVTRITFKRIREEFALKETYKHTLCEFKNGKQVKAIDRDWVIV